MFNVRIIQYSSGGYQVRVYDKPVAVPYEEGIADTKDDMWFNPDSGLWERVIGRREDKEDDLIENPFTGEKERIRTENEFERSMAVSMNRTVNRLYYLTRSNVWDWFVTLTFDPEKVDSFNFSECTKKLSKWLNNCKSVCSEMKYIVVPERHKSGRYHFHGLFASCDALRFEDSGKKEKGGKVIYNIGAYKLGFTTATQVESTERVAKYVTKYITKDLCSVTFGKKRYWASKNLAEAEVLDLVLEPEAKAQFLLDISDYIQYGKTVKTVYLTTDYFELSLGVDIKV